MQELSKLTLKLFNAVESQTTDDPTASKLDYVDINNGLIIKPNALWNKDAIISHYTNERLNGNSLNKTFHKSWDTIKNTSEYELVMDQILHYISTYGTNFEGEVYIPIEELNVPIKKVKFIVIQAQPRKFFIKESMNLLQSGIALTSETIHDLLSVLELCDYRFTNIENIKNKEVFAHLIDKFGIIPTDPVSVLRYAVFKSTGETLLIKSSYMLGAIKLGYYNPAKIFKDFGYKELSTIFNRFKPIFLAYKNKCPSVINKISSLSKKHHKPLVQNPLNTVTSRKLTREDVHWLKNATLYSLFKAMSVCHTRMGGQKHFVYRIRNGKSWVDTRIWGDTRTRLGFVKIFIHNYNFILDFIRKNYDFSGRTVFFPKNIEYALPTSEKMFVGNIPTGTKFYAKRMAVGVYWENDWGAIDIDISGINVSGKIGWNTSHKTENMMYSGDITNAPKGAVEYLWSDNYTKPTIVKTNIYTGSNTAGYKIIVGEAPPVGDMSDNRRAYMMNPNNLLAEVRCASISKETTQGIVFAEGDKTAFVILNFGSSNTRVSGQSQLSMVATQALFEQWQSPLTLRNVCEELGFNIVETPADAEFDLSVDALTKSTFINLFNTK